LFPEDPVETVTPSKDASMKEKELPGSTVEVTIDG
jgi:hypothetical protein